MSTGPNIGSGRAARIVDLDFCRLATRTPAAAHQTTAIRRRGRLPARVALTPGFSLRYSSTAKPGSPTDCSLTRSRSSLPPLLIESCLNTHKPDSDGKKIRTLVVDDSGIFRETVSAFLAMLPEIEQTGVAANGHEAVRLVSMHQPDLLVLDLQMPGLNGLETMECIRRLNRATRIVLLTVHDADTVRDECLARGADAFVSKYNMTESLPGAIRLLFPEKYLGPPEPKSCRNHRDAIV